MVFTGVYLKRNRRRWKDGRERRRTVLFQYLIGLSVLDGRGESGMWRAGRAGKQCICLKTNCENMAWQRAGREERAQRVSAAVSSDN